MPTCRIAQIVHLKPTAIDAYKACHAAVWPEVLQQIQDCNIRDCNTRLLLGIVTLFILTVLDSIFFDNDRTIFATFKYVGDDWEGDMKRMRENPKVREWWAMTDGMQVG